MKKTFPTAGTFTDRCTTAVLAGLQRRGTSTGCRDFLYALIWLHRYNRHEQWLGSLRLRECRGLINCLDHNARVATK